MTGVLYALVGILGTSIGLNIWLTYQTIAAAKRDTARAERDGDIRVAQVVTETELTREEYEHEQTKKALEQADVVIHGLEETIASYLNQPIAPGLAPNDVDNRVRLLAQQLGQASRARREVRAATGEAVSETGPADGTVHDLRNPDVLDV